MNKRAQKVEITSESILNDILEVKDRCMQKVEPITYKSNGEEYETGEYKFEHTGALKALELLGKHLKLFTERTENVTHNINEDVTELTPEQRKARIKELLNKNKGK